MYDRKGRTPDEGDQANRRKDQRAPEPGVLYNSVLRGGSGSPLSAPRAQNEGHFGRCCGHDGGEKRTEHAFQGLVSSCSGHLGAWGPSRALESVRRQTVDPPTPKELVFRLAEYVWRESGTPEQQIAYRRWQSAAGAGYGIIAKIQEPEYHVVTSPITKDLDTVERLVQRLNQEQTPVRVFEERYLLGNLLDLMKN